MLKGLVGHGDDSDHALDVILLCNLYSAGWPALLVAPGLSCSSRMSGAQGSMSPIQLLWTRYRWVPRPWRVSAESRTAIGNCESVEASESRCARHDRPREGKALPSDRLRS